MKYTTALFDLDGTVTDSGPGIINSIRHAINKYGLPMPSEEVLRTFIGPPLKEQFQAVCGLTDEEGVRMVEAYREYYTDKGIFENSVYEGVPEMLEKLQKAGVRILMATAKPEHFAKQIAEHFDFAKYFEFIGGACMDGRRTDKYEVIEYVLASCGISGEEREHAVMIGDRSHDMIGAQKAGLHSLGILYGYGSREELEEAASELIAETPEKGCDLLL